MPTLRSLMFVAIVTSISIAQDPLTKVERGVLDATRGGRVAECLILMHEQADLSPAARLLTKLEKGRFVRDALWEVASRTQAPLCAWLREQGIEFRSYYVVNLVWVRATRDVVLVIAAREDVSRVEGNPVVPGLLDVATRRDADAATSSLTVEPSLSYVNAPAVWALGYTGQGVVVGGQDTGYQWNHPALVNQYRGWNGTSANHDYNWHDAIHSGGGICGPNNPAPCDDNSHGTHTMGTVVGDDGGVNQIGMAPGAQWICARNMDQGNGTPVTYIECFEWFLAPYPVTGTPAQGNPALAPDVTTNSWACPPSEGCTTTSLVLALQAQRAAGIVTIVAAGNSGSGCGSVTDPPAIHDEAYSIGALSISTGSIAGFSSRGPVTVDGSNRMKPDLAAPGVNIRSSVPGNAFAGGWSGTSMATPHVAGAVALLFSAHPALKGQVDITEQILNDTAVPITSTNCGGLGGSPNNVYGHGLLDALAAVNAVRQVSVTAATAQSSGAAGQFAQFTVSVTNTGYLTDSFNLSLTGNTWTTTFTPSLITGLAAGNSAMVTVQVLIPSSALLNSTNAVQLVATSQNWTAATAASPSLITTATSLAPILLFAQPGGPATGVTVNLTDLLPTHVYHTILSTDLCGTPGSGPYLGLCANDFNSLLFQFTLPLGTVPFHFQATTATEVFGPYSLPPALTFDALCFDLTAGTLLGLSQVTRYTVQ